MSSPFDWGSDKDKNATQGKSGKLPRHISRMNEGTTAPEAKGSVMKGGKSMSDSGLPWGGADTSEKSKAYVSGLPKDKGSVTSATGERKSPVGTVPGTPNVKPTVLPQGSHAAHAGYKTTIQSKSMGMKGMKKK
jgi:hypothetical protein